jgi:hypothetical protein
MQVDPNLLGTSSIDTTCTVWGLETGQVLGRSVDLGQIGFVEIMQNGFCSQG